MRKTTRCIKKGKSHPHEKRNVEEREGKEDRAWEGQRISRNNIAEGA